jgi:hypothetical protein
MEKNTKFVNKSHEQPGRDNTNLIQRPNLFGMGSFCNTSTARSGSKSVLDSY